MSESAYLDAEQRLVQRFLQTHSHTAARLLEQQPTEQVVELMQAMDTEVIKQLVEHMLPEHIARLYAYTDSEHISRWLSGLSMRRLTMVLRQINEEDRTALLAAMPLQTSTACRFFLDYPEDTVGAWMSDRVFVLPADISIDEALDRIRHTETLLDSDVIPVVDVQQALLGVISYAKLFSANRSTRLSELLQQNQKQEVWQSLPARASLKSAAKHRGWRQYDTLPVTNTERQVIGAFRHVHLRDALDHHKKNDFPRASASATSMVSSVSQSYLHVIDHTLSRITKPEP